jgi:hypothetical protein
VNPDYIAKKLSEESNIGILSDHRGRLIHASQRTARSASCAMATTQDDRNLVSATDKPKRVRSRSAWSCNCASK